MADAPKTRMVAAFAGYGFRWVSQSEGVVVMRKELDRYHSLTAEVFGNDRPRSAGGYGKAVVSIQIKDSAGKVFDSASIDADLDGLLRYWPAAWKEHDD